MDKHSKTYLFEEMPVPRAIASMAVPTIISQMISVIYNLADTFFIGRTGDSLKMAGITVSFTLFFMTTAFGNVFGIGGGSPMARLAGKKDTENARKVCAFSVSGAFLVSVAYALLVGLFLDPLLKLLGASEATMGFARQYTLTVVVAGTLPIILSAVCAHLLRNAGYSRQASIGLSAGGILNIILDPLFMFVLLPEGMEVFGAALATLLSNVIACIYMMITLGRLSRTTQLSLNPKDMKGIRKEDLKELFAVGVPSGLLTGLFDLANIVLNALMAAHGDLQLAALGIVMKAERIPTAVNVGLCQGMLPIIAYNYAAGNRPRMQKVIATGRIFGLGFCALCIAGFQIFAKPVMNFFLSTNGTDPETALITIGFGVTYLRLRSLASPVQFLNYSTSFTLQALGDGKATLTHSVVRILVFYIPLMFLINALLGDAGLAGTMVLSEGLAAVFAMLLLRHRMKKEKA